MDVKRVLSVPIDAEWNWVYDTRKVVDRQSAFGGWVNCRMHWDGGSAVPRCGVATCVHIPFIHYTKEESYASRLLLIVRNGLVPTDAAPISHGLEYVAFTCPFDSVHHLTNSEYWCSEMQFGQRFFVRGHAALFVNWHRVDIFGILCLDEQNVFVRVPW